MSWKRVLKSYSSIITKTIPLFLAVGFLNLLFSHSGWFPNKDMGDMAVYLYHVLVPVLLGYYAGKRPGNQTGGITGAIASAGLVCAGSNASILGAVIVGGTAGYLSDRCYSHLENRLPAGFEMIVKNLMIGVGGTAFGVLSFYVLSPVFLFAGNVISGVLGTMTERGLLPLVSLVVEPLKIMFLNNSLNHGVFIPLGMEQMERTGKSVLFLIESNPGPGLGILLAYLALHRKENKDAGDTVTVMAVHLLGGIHEVYFPYVLSDLRLLAAVMAGGAAGTMCFGLLDAGLKGPVSPGSILTILLMAGTGDWGTILLGILASCAVSFGAACVILGGGGCRESGDNRNAGEEAGENRNVRTESGDNRNARMEDREDIMKERQGTITHIYVVCDAGLGSSAMGAALLRRKLKEAGTDHVTVQAAAYDDIPDDADLLVCQRDFYSQRMKGKEMVETMQIEKLTSVQEYERLIEGIKGRI